MQFVQIISFSQPDLFIEFAHGSHALSHYFPFISIFVIQKCSTSLWLYTAHWLDTIGDDNNDMFTAKTNDELEYGPHFL